MAKDVLPFVFLDIAIVIVVARLMGRLFVRLRQPAVIGEILGGIVLGPSVLGLLPGNLPQCCSPPTSGRTSRSSPSSGSCCSCSSSGSRWTCG